jgi:hypothetical protein
MVFACVYVLASRLIEAMPKMREKRAEAGFRLFWNNINQQMMDYQKTRK